MPTLLRSLMLLLVIAVAPLGASAAQEYCMDPARPAPDYYVHPAQFDFLHVLGPPPAAASPQGKADLRAVLEAQRTRTRSRVEDARADVCLSIFRFADVIGPGFKPENLPFTIVFFQRVFSDDQHAVLAAKSYFNRPRPFVVDRDVSPAVAQPANASYPSGHATFAYVTAILLADIVPERGPQIFARAQRYAHNRVIAGVHYPSDVEAGRISASVIDNVLLHDQRFNADFARSRAEVRHALGLK